MTLITHSSAAERLAALREAIGDSVSAIQKAAAILRQMEEAKDDLSAVPSHLLNLLRRINGNLMLPEVAVQLSGTLRAKVALLPLAEQRLILDPECRLDVVLANGDTAAISPQRMTPAQIKQVFGDGYIRQRAEQMAVGLQPQRRAKGRPAGSTRIHVDKDKGCVEYHGHIITKATLLRWINEL
jgi:hypothetical protein